MLWLCVSMQVNSHGKVLSLESINLYGEQLLKNYDGKGKDKLLVTNELIQRAIAMGYLVSGDTVYFYIDTPKSAVYSNYKLEFEQEMTAYADLNTAVEQYRINEPLPEKVQPETETTQESEIPAVASETIPETTVPESSTQEQEVTVQEEISVQTEIIPQEEPVQEEILVSDATPQENPPQIQETEPDVPVNVPVQNETTAPTTETSIFEEQPSDWNYENWENWNDWYGYDDEYQTTEYSGHDWNIWGDWYDYGEEYETTGSSENWNFWGDWYHNNDECETSENSENNWNWDMWSNWDDWYHDNNIESQETTENWNSYSWKNWKNYPAYYSYGQEECTTDPCEPEEEEDTSKFSEYWYFDYEELP